MSFTAKELEEALNKVKTADNDFPEYPLRNGLEEDYSLWNKSTFPIVLTRVGEEENVGVYCEEYFGGEEGGDHHMYIILRTGSSYRGDERFFQKTGEYNSWDTSYWDGGFTEVEPKEVTVTQWATKK